MLFQTLENQQETREAKFLLLRGLYSNRRGRKWKSDRVVGCEATAGSSSEEQNKVTGERMHLWDDEVRKWTDRVLPIKGSLK